MWTSPLRRELTHQLPECTWEGRHIPEVAQAVVAEAVEAVATELIAAAVVEVTVVMVEDMAEVQATVGAVAVIAADLHQDVRHHRITVAVEAAPEETIALDPDLILHVAIKRQVKEGR